MRPRISLNCGPAATIFAALLTAIFSSEFSPDTSPDSVDQLVVIQADSKVAEIQIWKLSGPIIKLLKIEFDRNIKVRTFDPGGEWINLVAGSGNYVINDERDENG